MLHRTGRPAGHRLDRRQAEPLHQRGLGQGVGPPVEVGEVGVGDEPGEVGPIAQAEPLDGLAERGDVGVEDVAEVADQDQAGVGPAPRANASISRGRFLCGLRPPT